MLSYLNNRRVFVFKLLIGLSISCSSFIFAAALSNVDKITYFQHIAGLLAVIILFLILAYLVFKSLVHRTIIQLIGISVLWIGLIAIIEQLEFNNFIDQQRLSVLEKVSSIRSRLEGSIQTDLEIGNALSLFIKSNNFTISEDQFNTLAESIIQSNPNLTHIALAENLVINFVYPYEKNEKAIGLNYRQNAEQWPTIERAISTNKNLLAGPVNLVQGGTAFIGRLPIFKKTDNDIKQLWGLMSVVIDMEALFNSADLYSDNGLTFALRGTDATGENGAVFFGNEQLFYEDSIIQDIMLPEGTWQIAAEPKTGWPTKATNQLKTRLIIFLFYLFVMFFIIFRAIQHHKNQLLLLRLQRKINENDLLVEEQKNLNKKLYHSQKLKAIGQLTSGVAHDFNNILTAISGYAQLAKVNVAQHGSPEKLASYINEVLKSGNRAKDLIMQLLAFSRGQDIKSQPISPTAIIKETITMLQSTIPTSIELTAIYDDECTIKSDPTQFQQIVINLIINARDAIRNQQGKIKIKIEKLDIDLISCSSCSEEASGQYMVLTIEDDGEGISTTDIEHVFEPFYTTKKRNEGTGMGLSVVHGIVHSANGHIVLESVVSMGTTIKLIIPLCEELVQQKQQHSEEINLPPNKLKGHILLVDDEVAITDLFRDFLTNMDLMVTVFNDPRKAFNYFQKHSSEIDLVITDQTMPNMKGSEMAQRIRQLNQTIPIILCSGYSEILNEQNVKEFGISSFFTKPIDLKSLSLEVKKLLST